jgi:hypothetical protein
MSVYKRDESTVCKYPDIKTELGLTRRDELIYFVGYPRAKSKRVKYFRAYIYSNLAC